MAANGISSTLKRVASTDRDISPPPKRRATPTSATTSAVTSNTSKAVANFFKPASQKEPDNVTFRIVQDSLLVARYGGTPKSDPSSDSKSSRLKIAAFDFDSTLISAKSGLKFARGEDDWKWWHACVPGRLKELHAQGYRIVVVSNQGAVSLRQDVKTPKDGMKSVANFKGKVKRVLAALDLEGIGVYAATEKDIFRKPRIGMWTQILPDLGISGEEIDLEKSVFVGDAAGRAEYKAQKRPKDHSSSDRDFASNVGVPFQTPEEFFLGEPSQPFTRVFEPKDYLGEEVTSKTDSTPILFTASTTGKKELVLFCGSPGAGKSTFYWRHLAPLGYERVNQDILKSRDKCMKVATQILQDQSVSGEGKAGVVVDNTNADIETRAAWINLGRRLSVEVRLVHFTSPPRLCEHNDTVRALTSDKEVNPEARTMLPKMAFTGFAARYRAPRIEEGFRNITTVDFKFEGTEEQKRLWSQYWIS